VIEDPGFGFWILVVVFAGNLMMIPLWFLIGFLRRGHDLGLKEGETFLELVQRNRGDEEDPQLDESIAYLREELEKASGLGPLWGRKHVTNVRIWRGQMRQLHPEVCEPVAEMMIRP